MRGCRKWLTLRAHIALVALAALLCAITTWLVLLYPRVDIPAPVFDLGVVPQMANGECRWVIRNSGRATLKLWLSDEGTCGCPNVGRTEARLAGSPISERLSRDEALAVSLAPGEQLTILAYWATKRCTGNQSGSYVEICTNDPDSTRVRLSLTAAIVPAEVLSKEG
jgi:hypothetical protein